MNIVKGELKHQEELLALYKEVAGIPDGIIRSADEITTDFISEILHKSIDNGLILMTFVNDRLVGEIHAYTPNIFAFQHILTDLTIVVHPNFQGQKIGKRLFTTFLEIVKNDYSHILRLELFTREHNTRNVQFYERLGFINEGRQQHKIFTTNGLETPLHMAWFNPNFSK